MIPGGDMDDVTHSELARWLGRVEKKLDAALDDHEERLRRVERTMYVAAGLALAGASSGIGSLLTLLSGGGG